jgi:hypothetical protein
MIAFITKRNKPSVIMVTGIVKKTSTGFTNTFNKPKTTATIMADLISLTIIPGK